MLFVMAPELWPFLMMVESEFEVDLCDSMIYETGT